MAIRVRHQTNGHQRGIERRVFHQTNRHQRGIERRVCHRTCNAKEHLLKAAKLAGPIQCGSRHGTAEAGIETCGTEERKKEKKKEWENERTNE